MDVSGELSGLQCYMKSDRIGELVNNQVIGLNEGCFRTYKILKSNHSLHFDCSSRVISVY